MKAHLVQKKITDRRGRATTVWVKMNSDYDIPRSKMPQIRSEHFEAFKKYLADNKVSMDELEMDAKDLKPTQKHIDHKKVELTRHMAPEYAAKKKILISHDGYILDGHHRWAGAMRDGTTVPTNRVNMNMDKLLPLVRKFPNVEYASLNHMTDTAKQAQQALKETGRIDYAKRLEAMKKRKEG